MTKYGIRARYYYYAGTLHAPTNGFLRDPYGQILEFDSREQAESYLRRRYGRMSEDGGKNTYSIDGRYVLGHGEYSRPRYTIVKRASGRR